jgi:thiamine monophosphate kinase
MASIDHKSRSPSPRVIETSPAAKQSRPIATIDYNDSLVEHLKREMSEPKFSPRLNKSFAPSPALMNSAKKQDRELSSWLYNSMSAT